MSKKETVEEILEGFNENCDENPREVAHTYVDAFMDAKCEKHEVCDMEKEKCDCWKLLNGNMDLLGQEIITLDYVDMEGIINDKNL